MEVKRCSYDPSRNNIDNHLKTLNKSLAFCSSQYENFVIIGDKVRNSSMAI